MTEAQYQIEVFKWARHPAVLHTYPELALLYHIPNGGKRNAVEAAHFKQQGVLPGVADLHLPVARGCYYSLYIEMKADKGRPSANQVWFGKNVTALGNFWVICHGSRQAIQTLEWYLKGAVGDCPVRNRKDLQNES